MLESDCNDDNRTMMIISFERTYFISLLKWLCFFDFYWAPIAFSSQGLGLVGILVAFLGCWSWHQAFELHWICWPMISATYHLMCQYANMRCVRFFPLAHLKAIAVVRHTLSYSIIFFCTAHTRWAQQATDPGYSTILLRPALLPAQLSTSRSGCQWRQDCEANCKQIHKPMVEHNQEQLLFEFWEGCHGAKFEK